MLPDWAVVDLRQPPTSQWPGKIAAAGFFDELVAESVRRTWNVSVRRPSKRAIDGNQRRLAGEDRRAGRSSRSCRSATRIIICGTSARDSVDPRYTLDEILRDIGGGHRIVSTVFIECGTMYREGCDAGTASAGRNGVRRRPGGDERLGQVRPGAAWRRASSARRCSRTDSAPAKCSTATWRSPATGSRAFAKRPPATPATPCPIIARRPATGSVSRQRDFRRGFAELAPRGLVFEGLCYHPQMDDLVDLGPGVSRDDDRAQPLRHPAGHRPVPPGGRSSSPWRDESCAESANCPNVDLQGRRPDDGHERLRLARARGAAEQRGAGRRQCVPTSSMPWSVSAPARCIFESNFPVDKVSVILHACSGTR